jgi:hypothetical protein
MNYWVNSNTGDYITENNGQYKLHLLSRYYGREFSPSETIIITKLQFNNVKGFVPIKQKKLFSRLNSPYLYYGPTLPDGSKGYPERYQLPTQSEMRAEILKKIGI